MISQNPVFNNNPLEQPSVQSALYKQVVENSPDLISIVDRDCVYRMVNSAYLNRYEKTEEEIVGRHAAEILGQEVFEKIIKPNLDRCFAGETVNCQDWFSYPEPDKRYMDVYYYPLPNGGGLIERVVVIVRDITDHIRAEKALRESEERYHRMLNTTHDMIAVLNADVRLLFTNKAWIDLAGYSAEEPTASGAFSLVHPDDRESARNAFQEILNGRPVREFEYRRIDRDGNATWVECNADLTDWPGEEKAVVTVLRDISKRKQAEEALRASEERYRMLIEEANDIIYTLDLNTGKVTSVNSYALETLGYTKDEFLAMPHFLDMTHPDERDMLAARLQEVLAGDERIPNFPLRVRKADGAYIDAEQNWAILRDREGAPQTFMGIARDVTERKRMEEALRLSEERYHRILDATHDMILVLDANAKILFANRSWRENASYTFEEINEIDIFETIHPNEREKAIRAFQQAMAGESARNIEYRVLTKDGGVKWMEANADPINWPGADKTIAITARDFTQRKRAELALENSLSLLGATLESTVDGILVVDNDRKIVAFNEKFMEMWRIPESVMASEDSSASLEFVLDQLEDPEDFLRTVDIIHSRSAVENLDIVKFKDGRVFERHSKPHMMGNDVIGLVLSYRDITDRIKAEEALRESEERYRSIFWEAPDIFYTLDFETWIITDANSYALESLEYTPEFLGKIHVSDIIHPDDFAHAANRLRDMVTNKDRIPHFPLRILTRTGKVRHIEQSGVIFWDENGAAKTFLGLAHDVTYRKEQDETIRKRNEKIAALYEVAKAANATLDMKKLIDLMLDLVPRITNSSAMAILLFNEESQQFEYLAHYGISEETVKATNHLGLDEGIQGHVVKRREPLLIRNIKEQPMLSRPEHVKKLNIESSIAAPLLLENDVIGFLWVSREPGNPYDTEDLDLVGAMANHIAAAITNAKLFSQVLQRETRLQTILETSQDGISVLSSGGKITYRNSAMSSIFGYSKDDDWSEIDAAAHFAPESFPALEDIRRRLRDGKQVRKAVQFKGRRKDGATFDAEARLGDFVENGKRFGVAVIRDITERNRMRFQLEQSSKLAAVGELAAGVAHEINNPIATLDVQTGLMHDILDDEREKLEEPFLKRIEEYLNIVDSQVQRCRLVTESLFSFSRSPEGGMESCEINKLLKKTVKLIANLTDKDPKLQLELDERLPRFFGDPNRLEQVFVNLLNNALKAIKPEGSITIATRAAPDEDILIAFKDTGPGIEPEIMDRIFDPFFTTAATSGGTGLGLSISYYIIKEMDGRIDVESSPGKGATFTITLPGMNKARQGEDNA